ncbi:hypothetical protein [Anaerococcus tetradius]|uniref:Uncharacterized protein n=1 Tax=Anaerococcus tetradius ATCC 35098 TaxID=525255 RepID=C2CG20_9FIRM|nr:hypothetical protein [Anaerococcus tetradius]EEI83548.1 hypothetical protein HMPREF0077_0430 [Anaerococcus tetradius ATCC 35098]
MFNDDKSLTVQAFVNMFKTDIDIFKNNRIAVLTSFGLVVGDLIDNSNENPTTLQSVFISMDESIKKSFDEEKPDSEISIFLTLKNAEIITSGNKINLPIISIFYDQIIGISLSE